MNRNIEKVLLLSLFILSASGAVSAADNGNENDSQDNVEDPIKKAKDEISEKDMAGTLNKAVLEDIINKFGSQSQRDNILKELSHELRATYYSNVPSDNSGLERRLKVQKLKEHNAGNDATVKGIQNIKEELDLSNETDLYVALILMYEFNFSAASMVSALEKRAKKVKDEDEKDEINSQIERLKDLDGSSLDTQGRELLSAQIEVITDAIRYQIAEDRRKPEGKIAAASRFIVPAYIRSAFSKTSIKKENDLLLKGIEKRKKEIEVYNNEKCKFEKNLDDMIRNGINQTRTYGQDSNDRFAKTIIYEKIRENAVDTLKEEGGITEPVLSENRYKHFSQTKTGQLLTTAGWIVGLTVTTVGGSRLLFSSEGEGEYDDEDDDDYQEGETETE